MQLQAIAVSSFGPPVRLALRVRKLKAVRVHERIETDDVALMARVAAGDREAFARLFARYAPRVKSYLLRLGAPGAGAEDLAQDALINVWRRAARFDANRAAVSTWIFVIARNAWIDRLRREKVELAYRNGVDEPFKTDDAPDEAVERRQTVGQIRAALDLLTVEQKQVVQLAFFEDKPHSEIAEVLALPLGTVKSRLRLALIKLRAHWERYS